MTHNQRLIIIKITHELEDVYNKLYNYEQVYRSPTVRNAIVKIDHIQAITRNMLKGRR